MIYLIKRKRITVDNEVMEESTTNFMRPSIKAYRKNLEAKARKKYRGCNNVEIDFVYKTISKKK